MWWDAIENKAVDHYAKIAVFSDKYELLGAIDLNDDLEGELLFSFMPDDTFLKNMVEAPKEKYLFILNQSKMLMLDENNESYLFWVYLKIYVLLKKRLIVQSFIISCQNWDKSNRAFRISVK